MRIDNAVLRHQYSIAETTDKLQSGLRTNLDKLAARMAANIGKNSTASIQDAFNQQRNNSRNSEIALSLTAQGGLSEISDSLKRMRELVMTTTNPSTTSNDRESVQKELVQLQDNIKQVVTNTDYNGTKLFDGSFNANQQSTFGASVFSAVASTSETVKGVYELTVTGPSSSNPADTVTRLSDVINKVDQLRTNASNSLSSQERPAAATETVNLLTWEEMQKEIERMKGESDKRAAEIISANRWTHELSNQLTNRNSVDLKA